MHPRAYTSLAALEPVGWYYQARARCLARLIEREAHAGLLEVLLGQAAQGDGQLLVIEGPAGVGKSSLLRVAGEMATERR